ncbi:MAG: hypothetical protein ACK5ZY_07685 [Cyclobacteriaceae bacterium]
MTILLDSCNDKQKLDRNDVEYIEIQKQADTVSFLLTSAQIDDFIDNLNKSSVKGLTKYLPEYTLKVYIKGDSAISFRTSNNLIKQSDDKTYVIERTDYFRTLWLRQAGLSDNWFEYFPFYTSDNGLAEKRGTVDREHLENVKTVLTYYKHTWTDIRGQLFYEGPIDKELLWNYTSKANDSTWISDHK